MAWFNVVAPCVVDGLHYVRPTVQPIEVDDDAAVELLAEGAIEPYPKPAGFFVERVEPGAFKSSSDQCISEKLAGVPIQTESESAWPAYTEAAKKRRTRKPPAAATE